RVVGYIHKGIEEGAKLVVGGPERPEGIERGYFVQPTLFADVEPEMTIAQEEIFGPVLSVLPYSDEDEAVRIANATNYGLAGADLRSDGRALAVGRWRRAGQVAVNGARFNPRAPFGGYKQTGNGRECGRCGLEGFLEIKSIQC